MLSRRPQLQADDVLSKAFLGAALALLGNVVLQLWRYFRESYTKRVDDASKLVSDAADAGAEYWIKEKPARPTDAGDKDLHKRLDDLALAEIKIEGYQSKLNLARVLLESKLHPVHRSKLIEMMSDLQDLMTSGDFGAPVRAAEAERARALQRAATALIVHLNTSATRAVSFWGMREALFRAVLVSASRLMYSEWANRIRSRVSANLRRLLKPVRH
jgi:hypothetical protein